MTTASVVSRLLPRLTGMAARLDELDRLLADPEVAQNPRSGTSCGSAARSIARCRSSRHGLPPMRRSRKPRPGRKTSPTPRCGRSTQAEVTAQEQKREAAEQRLVDLFVVEDDDASRNVILEVRAGTGGDEAALWASELLKMYTHYAAGHGAGASSRSPTPGRRSAASKRSDRADLG